MRAKTLNLIGLTVLPWLGTAALVAACLPLTTGCVVREEAYAPGEGEVVVSTEPPPPIDEAVTVAPDPYYVWIGGVWVWGGGGWHWNGGHWARPPHPGARWVAPRYEVRGSRRVFVRGGWR